MCFNLGHNGFRSFQRCCIRQHHIDHKIALIFFGYKSAGNFFTQQHNDHHNYPDHDANPGKFFYQVGHNIDISSREFVKNPVKPVIKLSKEPSGFLVRV